MNYVDLIIIVIFVLYLLVGFRRGFLGVTLDLLAFLAAIVVAIFYYQQFGNWLAIKFNIPSVFIKPIGFLGLWVLAQLLFSLVATAIYYFIPSSLKSHRINKVAGLAPAAVQALILIGVILALALALPFLPKGFKGAIETGKISAPFGQQALIVEQNFENKIGSRLADTLTFFTVDPNWAKTGFIQKGKEETAKLPYQATSTVFDAASEQRIIELMNRDRQANGLPPLQSDEKLQLAGRDYAKEMFENGYFGHIDKNNGTPATRAQAAGATFVVIGENLAFSPLADLAHQGLMNSPTHRDNILSKEYSRVGVGVADGGQYGRIFVEEFAD